jgi:hypothetical protein
MDHGRRVDLGPARILDGHGDAELDGGIADEAGAADAADPRQLDGDGIGHAIGMGLDQGCEAIDGFVEHQRPVAIAAQRPDLGIAGAGLLHVIVEIAGRPQEAAGLMGVPAAIGIGEEHDPAAHRRAHGGQALDILIGVEADLHLDAPVALGDIGPGAGDHALGLVLRDRAIEIDLLAIASAEKLGERQARLLAQDIPAGHVKRRFGVGMALQQMIHAPVDGVDLGRVLADQGRGELGEGRPRAGGEGRVVEGPQRRHLAPAGDAGIGLDGTYDGIESQRRAAAGADIGAVAEGLVLAIAGDGGDAHGGLLVTRPPR